MKMSYSFSGLTRELTGVSRGLDCPDKPGNDNVGPGNDNRGVGNGRKVVFSYQTAIKEVRGEKETV